MDMFLRIDGQNVAVKMDEAGSQSLTVGSHTYRPARMAKRIRQLARKLWKSDLDERLLDERLCFESPDSAYDWKYEGDGGCFTTSGGASVRLGKWDESVTIGIAMHEFAHEMHMQSGGYDASDDIVREAIALLVEREVGLVRTFENEPYYTASNLIWQLSEMWAFHNQSFRRRWSEMVAITTDVDLADLVNYYLDRNENLGLERWLKRYSDNLDVRETVMSAVASCSLRYSLAYRRTLITTLVRCHRDTSLQQILEVLDAIVALDDRHPDDDMNEIIAFCFAPLIRKRRMLAFG